MILGINVVNELEVPDFIYVASSLRIFVKIALSLSFLSLRSFEKFMLTFMKSL